MFDVRIYRIAVNDIWEAQFQYNDPTLEICQGDGKQYVSKVYKLCSCDLSYYIGFLVDSITSDEIWIILSRVTLTRCKRLTLTMETANSSFAFRRKRTAL